jgi:uncharacterized membrane protein YciS (DUF1049 family)
MKLFILSNLVAIIVPAGFLIAGLIFIKVFDWIENRPRKKAKVIDLIDIDDLDITERFYQN